MRLNGEAYSVIKDELIYDNSHPIDATNIEIDLSLNTSVGIIERGQIIYYNDGKYTLEAGESGVASAIAASTSTYAADDTSLVIAVYTSGAFRASRCKGDIDAAVIESLRTRGIYIK